MKLTPHDLRKAAKKLQGHWGQTRLYSHGRWCVIGVVAQAVSGNPDGDFGDLYLFEDKITTNNDASDCNELGAQLFLLICADAREAGHI